MVVQIPMATLLKKKGHIFKYPILKIEMLIVQSAILHWAFNKTQSWGLNGIIRGHNDHIKGCAYAYLDSWKGFLLKCTLGQKFGCLIFRMCQYFKGTALSKKKKIRFRAACLAKTLNGASRAGTNLGDFAWWLEWYFTDMIYTVKYRHWIQLSGRVCLILINKQSVMWE